MSVNSKVVLVLFTLTACSNPVSKINSDIARLERSVEDLRGLQAEQTTVIASARNEIRLLQGRVEQLEYSQNQLSDIKSDISTLRQRVPPPAIVPAEELDADEAIANQVGGVAGTTFKQGLDKIRVGNYAQALVVMRECLGLAQGQEWTAHVLFWIGVINDGLGQPKEALRSYHECASQYPKSPRAPTALLRQASSFTRLGDAQTAKLTLKKVITSYPSSKEAAVAKQRLKDL